MKVPLRLALGEDGPSLLTGLLDEVGAPHPRELGRDAQGRPTLCCGGQVWSLSRSRAAGRCAVAVAPEGQVGVDLVADPGGDFSALAAPLGLPPEDRPALLRQWAAREALLKALGLGILPGLEFVRIALDEAGEALAVEVAGRPAPGWVIRVEARDGLWLAWAWAR